MPARAYCGGDFVARLLNDFNDHVVPAHAPRGPRQTSTTSAPCGAMCKCFSSASDGTAFEPL